MAIERLNAGQNHWYKIDGEKADGVTTLIREGLSRPGLIRWASKITAAYAVDHWDELADMPPSKRLDTLMGAANADRDAAARRGTEVHRLASELMVGAEVDVPEELAGHVESYVRFLDEWHPLPVLVEATIANRAVGYAGTLDMVAEFPFLPGETWLLDIKTARSGVFGEVGLQLSAYANAEVYLDKQGLEHPMPTITATGVVHVRADGYDVYRLPHDPNVFGVFRHVAFIARQVPKMRDWVGPALSPRVFS